MNRTKYIVFKPETTSFRKNIIDLNNYHHRLIISNSLWKTFKCDKYNRYFYQSTLQKIKKNEKYMI